MEEAAPSLCCLERVITVNDRSFNYSYSAEHRREIEQIKQKYIPREQAENSAERKLGQLKRLDASCESAAQLAGLLLGVGGVLIFGVGMCCILVWQLYLLGVLIAMIGIPMMIAAKPVYDRALKERREKAASEIMRLTEELENGSSTEVRIEQS